MLRIFVLLCEGNPTVLRCSSLDAADVETALFEKTGSPYRVGFIINNLPTRWQANVVIKAWEIAIKCASGPNTRARRAELCTVPSMAAHAFWFERLFDHIHFYTLERDSYDSEFSYQCEVLRIVIALHHAQPPPFRLDWTMYPAAFMPAEDAAMIPADFVPAAAAQPAGAAAPAPPAAAPAPPAPPMAAPAPPMAAPAPIAAAAAAAALAHAPAPPASDDSATEAESVPTESESDAESDGMTELSHA
jgi:hypothetical protein